MAYHFYKALLTILSYVPFWFYHIVAYLLGRFFYYTGIYRKHVIVGNLKKCFPEKSEAEIKRISKDFYLHLADLIVESIKAYSFSAKQVRKRWKVNWSPEVNQLIEDGNKIAFSIPHYNNWEWATLGLCLYDTKKTPFFLVIYKTLKNQALDKLVRKIRSKFPNSVLFPKEKTLKKLHEYSDQLYTIGFAADQIPPNPYNSYWMEFLGMETGVFFGYEKICKSFNLIPVHGHVRKVKRSHYEVDLEIISKDPSTEPYGSITEAHMKLLEADIKENPAFWLWSHRRWKRKKPADFEQKRKERQQAKDRSK